jgi:hypothetical protein
MAVKLSEKEAEYFSRQHTLLTRGYRYGLDMGVTVAEVITTERKL